VVSGGSDGSSFSDKSIGSLTTNCKIGVLGGIGPEATGIFYRRTIERIQKEGLVDGNTDFPQIIINSIPAPELTGEEVTDEDLSSYRGGLRELDSFGVDFIVMVCNTIHLYRDRLQEEVRAPILDLRNEVKKALERRDSRSTLVLGTEKTVKEGLYSFRDIDTRSPSDKEVKELCEAVNKYNKGVGKEQQIEKVRSVTRKYLENGPECVVAGCTEFALMLEGEDIPMLNTIDVLVDATVERFSSGSHPKT